jgi:predicted DsbA family dithiol-disulfide isomerase
MFIQVVQDIVCPWCRIGHHNLEAALEQWVARGNERPDVQWFPYELDPIEPHANENYRDRLVNRKGLAPEQVAAMWERLNGPAAKVGITFRFDKIEFAQNTLLAHQLIALTPPVRQSALIEALHDAHFEEGKNVEEIPVLLEAARKAGASEDELAQTERDLRSEVRRDDVISMIGQARAAGITGVPFFIFDGKLSLSGAQPPEVILQAMEQAAAQQVPLHVS